MLDALEHLRVALHADSITVTERGLRLAYASDTALVDACAAHKAVARVHSSDDHVWLSADLRVDGQFVWVHGPQHPKLPNEALPAALTQLVKVTEVSP